MGHDERKPGDAVLHRRRRAGGYHARVSLSSEWDRRGDIGKMA